MFKKIEIWILYLALLLTIPVTIIFGFLVRQELVGSQKLGWLSKSALFLSEIPVQIKRIADETTVLSISVDRWPDNTGFVGSGSGPSAIFS